MPSAPDWRSASAYAYVDDLNAAEFAAEFLRRNPAYRQDWRRIRELPSLKVERQNNKRIGMPARCRQSAPSTPRRTDSKRAEEALRGVTIEVAKTVHPLGDHPSDEDAKLAEAGNQCAATGMRAAERRIDVHRPKEAPSVFQPSRPLGISEPAAVWKIEAPVDPKKITPQAWAHSVQVPLIIRPKRTG